MLAALALFGILSLGCWWQIRLLGDIRLHLGTFYGWFACAFGLYLAVLWLVRRSEQPALPRRAHVLSIGIVFLVAVSSRLVLLGTTPTLSDDIYRYVWDGRVQQAGIDPYAYPPNDAALAFLRDEQFAHINFPHLRTVYPPVSEWAFRLGASLAPTLTMQKMLFVCAELITFACLLFVLLKRRLNPLWVVAYAWHPLVILEIAGSGHNDALGVALLWLGIAAWNARQWLGVAMGWSAAFLSKFASVLLLPWWWCRRIARGWLTATVVLAAIPLAFCFSCVTALVESLSAMTVRFESNASVYLLLAWMLGSSAAARLASIGLAAACLLWWARRTMDPIRYLLGAFAVMALLSPVLHPWYLVWLIPCFCFYRPAAVVALTATVVLAYTVWPGRLADGRWVIPVWAHILEYAPVLALGAWSAARTLRVRPVGPDRNLHSVACTLDSQNAGLTRDLTVGIIIPARNEAAALGQVLAELPRGLVHDIIVVDNGSTDGTAEVAKTWLANLGGGSCHRPSLAAPLAAPHRGAAALDVFSRSSSLMLGHRGRSKIRTCGSLKAVAPAATGSEVVMNQDPQATMCLVTEPMPGYGRACLAGLAALDPAVDTIVFMDGDHSDYPEDLPKLLEPIAQGRADLVIGSRVTLAQPGSLTVQQRVGNRLACALMRGLFGVSYTDLGPFRAIRKDALDRLDMRDQAFGWTVEMQAKAARVGLRVEEVAVRYRPRIGRSKISGTISGTMRAGFAILSTIMKIAVSRSRLKALGSRQEPITSSLQPPASSALQ